MKPILFNTEMVRAILEGRKTVTRRVLKLPSYIQPQDNGLFTLYADGTCYENERLVNILQYLKVPYQVNDILYVRETWIPKESEENGKLVKGFGYKADITGYESMFVWRPSIHMPKEAARIFLKVTDVRVERLQDITEEQATKEGCKAGSFEFKGAVWGQEDTDEWTAIDDFSNVWQSTIKKDQRSIYDWNANPYVWVIEFERVEREEVL